MSLCAFPSFLIDIWIVIFLSFLLALMTPEFNGIIRSIALIRVFSLPCTFRTLNTSWSVPVAVLTHVQTPGLFLCPLMIMTSSSSSSYVGFIRPLLFWKQKKPGFEETCPWTIAWISVGLCTHFYSWRRQGQFTKSNVLGIL